MTTWYHHTNINSHGQGLVIDENTGENIAVVYKGENAPLIAAAPELLAALQQIAYYFDNNDGQFMANCYGPELGKILKNRINAVITKTQEVQ